MLVGKEERRVEGSDAEFLEDGATPALMTQALARRRAVIKSEENDKIENEIQKIQLRHVTQIPVLKKKLEN